jgi:PAS domain S-box-containing protein
VGVLLCDPAGLVVYANPRAGEIAGRVPGELLGTGLASAIDRGDMARVVEAWRAFVVGDAPVLRVEYRVLRRSGELRTVHAQLRRLPAPDGRALGFVAVLDDVTEALRADEAMRRAERMEELGQLAGGLAHEFNNLLTIIRGNLAFARGGLPPGSTAHDDLGEVDRAAERAGLLVRQLLALGRRQVLRLERVDVRAVVRDVTPRLRALCRPEVLLDVVWSAEPGVVRADAVQLAQVVANLVANACDAMPHGGTVSVDTGTATLGDDAASRAWGALPAGAYARLTVRDTGTGMDDAARARAFEPFFSTKPHGTGMGLGLPVAYGIVTQSGGGMRVESAPGRGTVVTVLLPLLAHEITEWPMEPVPGGSEVVLVAEASPALRGALARLLAAAGYAVEGVSTAADAVARARGGAYALLLCAAALPDGGGAAVAARVRRAHASLPVLLVARDDGEAASAAHAAASADGGPPTTWVLRAPLLGREVLATVRAALDGRPA